MLRPLGPKTILHKAFGLLFIYIYIYGYIYIYIYIYTHNPFKTPRHPKELLVAVHFSQTLARLLLVAVPVEAAEQKVGLLLQGLQRFYLSNAKVLEGLCKGFTSPT